MFVYRISIIQQQRTFSALCTPSFFWTCSLLVWQWLIKHDL